LPEGEFYVADLAGAVARSVESGEIIAKFLGVESGKGPSPQDCWWFESKGREISVPATRRYIDRVDVKNRTIWLRHFSELL
jgi:ribosomal 30S subunit maturation factor RimM